MNDADMTATKIPGLRACCAGEVLELGRTYGYEIGAGFNEWLIDRVERCVLEIERGVRRDGLRLEFSPGVDRAIRIAPPSGCPPGARWDDEAASLVLRSLPFEVRSDDRLAEPLAQLVVDGAGMTRVVILIPSLEEVAAGWDPDAK